MAHGSVDRDRDEPLGLKRIPGDIKDMEALFKKYACFARTRTRTRTQA